MSIKSPLEQTDLRVRRTHKLLWEALMAELSERTIEEIAVSDICERAMVHRTTFYKHYEDKYTLLEQGILILIMFIKRRAMNHGSLANIRDGNFLDGSLRKLCHKCFPKQLMGASNP